jgi:hypothetical protein
MLSSYLAARFPKNMSTFHVCQLELAVRGQNQNSSRLLDLQYADIQRFNKIGNQPEIHG